MINDGKCYIWLPSYLTLNKLTEETAALVNAVHQSLGLPTGFVAGDTNPHYLDLNDLDMGGAPFTRDATPGMAVCGPIENKSFLTLEYVGLIVAFGGEVEGFDVYFPVDPDATCYFDSEHTWATWGNEFNLQIITRNGQAYRGSQVGASGQPIPASQWLPYLQSGGTVLTRDQYLAIPEQAPE